MEKGDVVKYAVIVLVFAGLAAIVLVLQPSPTGHAILEDYTTEVDCLAEGYTWTNSTEENCTTIEDCVECEVDCVTEYTEVLCEENCTIGCDINDTECVECEVDCVTNYTEVLCEEGCLEDCEECVDVEIWQCVGDVCDSDNLDLCLTETDCTNANGYWYDDICNSEACVFETVSEFCSRLGDECGEVSAADANCGDSRTVDCGSCGSGYVCESGSCEEDTSISDDEDNEENDDSSSLDTTTQDSNKNLELSGQDKVLVSAGSSEEAELHVSNVGEYQLNCNMEGDWISSKEKIEYLNKGEEIDVKYKVSVPVGTDAGDYSKELIVKCNGGISESEIITITVIAGEGSITGDVIAETGEEKGTIAGITGSVIGEGSGRVIAYVVFLLVLAGAVVLVWKRHAQIRGLDDLLFKGKNWFNAKFHRK